MKIEGFPELLTVAEVAKILRVSQMTVHRLIAARELQGIRIGRSIRIPEENLRDYLRR